MVCSPCWSPGGSGGPYWVSSGDDQAIRTMHHVNQGPPGVGSYYAYHSRHFAIKSLDSVAFGEVC
eukprot:4076658-Heterocapsa_arctica.AAC.1